MKIKEIFRLIKKDIDNLNYENNVINLEIDEVKHQLKEICLILEDLSEKIYNSSNLTLRQINQTDNRQTTDTSTPISTDNSHFKSLNNQYLPISIGNRGVSTDKQTNRQTDKQTQNSFENAAEMLDSLDSIKKELRLKFKRLTEQELLIFSVLYQLDVERGHADYKSIASKINLTESSIRDYVRRLISKGIPLNKKKINNKFIQLSIPDSFKKIATLSTILKLREI